MNKRCFCVVGRLIAVGWIGLLAGCASGLWEGKRGQNCFSTKAESDASQLEMKNSSDPFFPPLLKPRGAKEPKMPRAAFGAELAKGRNLEQAGKYDEARTIYERLVARYPKRYEAYHRLAVVADHQRRHREAQALYTQAIRLNGSNPELFNDLGYSLYLQGKLKKAESAILKAVAMRPSNSCYRNNLGLVLGHLGRDDEALDQFRRGGSQADAYYNLAFVRAFREDVEGAKKCFRLALAADPDHERARRALESFEAYEKDPEAVADHGPVAGSGDYWVPYVEEDKTKAGASSDPASAARPGTQSLLKRAHTLMSHRTAVRQQ